jgi:hypothetical protein
MVYGMLNLLNAGHTSLTQGVQSRASEASLTLPVRRHSNPFAPPENGFIS